MIAREISSEEQTVSASTHEFVIEEEAVDETTNEIPLEEEIVNVIAHEVSTEIPPVSAEVEPPSKKATSDVPLLVDSSAKECSTSISLETKAVAIPAEKISAKHCPLGLNAEANEFVPQKTRFPELVSFGHADGVSDGTAAVKNRDKTAVDASRVHDPAGLNAKAKEFVPSSGGASGGIVAVPSELLSERSLNVFAREFVPICRAMQPFTPVRGSSVQTIFIKIENGKIDFQFSIFHFFTRKNG